MEKESLEKGYKQFRLEKPSINTKPGEDCFCYIGEVNSVVWEIPEKCKEYIKPLVDTMEEITKDFDTEPKIKSTRCSQGRTTTKRNNGELVKCENVMHILENNTLIMDLDNGFRVVCQDSTCNVFDHRQYLMDRSRTESLEEVYSRFQLERMGHNSDTYIGKLGSVTWEFSVSADHYLQGLQDVKTGIKTIYDNLEMFEDHFNSEPKILYDHEHKWIQRNREEHQDSIKGLKTGHLLGSYLEVDINNGFDLTLYMDGTFALNDRRFQLLADEKYKIIDEITHKIPKNS